MPLQKATQSVPFTQGLDTKSSQQLSAKPSLLFNSVFRDGTISKRWGRKHLPSAISGDGTQTSGEALVGFNDELVRINDGVAYGLSEQQDSWVTKPGGNNYATAQTKSLIYIPGGTGLFDRAIVNGIGVVAWNRGGIRVAVYDVETGTFFQTGAAPVASSTTSSVVPRCVVLGTKVVVLWADFVNTRLYSAVVDTTSPLTVPTQTAIRTDVYVSAITFDAIAYNANLAIVAYPTSATDIRLIGVDATGAVTASPAPTLVAGVAGVNGLQAGVLVQRDTAGNIYVVVGDKNARSTKYVVRNASFGAVLAATNIVTTGNWSGTTAEFYTAASIEMTANSITLMLANVANLATNISTFLGKCVLQAAGIATAFFELPSTAGLTITGDAVRYDGTAVFGVVNIDGDGNFTPPADGLQSSAWVLNLDGQVVARGIINASESGSPSILARVARSALDGTTASLLFTEQGRLAYSSIDAQVVQVTTFGIAEMRVGDVGANALPLLRLGDTLYIGGAYPRVYDGQFIGESGFSLYPGVVSATDTGVGVLSAGTYQWRLLYSYVGANGELTRGPVSPPVQMTLAVNRQVTIVAASMPLAMRDILVTGGNTLIELYRTTANGSIFYRTSSVLASPQNVTTFAGLASGGIPIADNKPDIDVQAGELLYTTGGVLDWEAPPAYSVACIHKGRLIIGGLEDPYAWMPSSEWVQGETVRFSTFTMGHVPSSTGPLVGCASMDGKLVLFTSQAAYVTIGDGPNNLGQNNYPPLERITSVDAGPLTASSIVDTPMGIMYQSTRGMQLLDRGLNCTFIGADVEAFSIRQWLVKAALLDAEAQMVRFLADDGSDLPGVQTGTLVPTLGGISLVYDYFYQQWSIFPNYGGQASCLYHDRYTMVRSDGAVWQEQPSTFRDEGAYYSSLVETAWLKLAGIQGFQRIWYAIVLGTYGSDFTLLWDAAVNYASTDPAVPIWGQSVTLDGAGEFTLGGQYEVRHHLGHKCVSVKFRFSDSELRGSGEGMALSDLTVEYGVKKGAWKLGASKTA